MKSGSPLRTCSGAAASPTMPSGRRPTTTATFGWSCGGPGGWGVMAANAISTKLHAMRVVKSIKGSPGLTKLYTMCRIPFCATMEAASIRR